MKKYYFERANTGEVLVLKHPSGQQVNSYKQRKIKQVVLEISDVYSDITIYLKNDPAVVYVVAFPLYFGKYWNKKTLLKVRQEAKEIFGDLLYISD